MEKINVYELTKTIKEYIHNRPKIKKVVGIILILVGLAAFFYSAHSRLMVGNYRS